MTVSGSSAWNPAVTSMVAQSLRNLGVIAEDENPTAGMYSTAVFQLNSIVAAAQATGLHVWTEEEGILFPQVGVPKYTIAGATPDAHTADADLWLQLTLTANVAAGAYIIDVNERDGVLAGDNIGVILTNGYTFWTTVAGSYDPLLDSGGNILLDDQGHILYANESLKGTPVGSGPGAIPLEDFIPAAGASVGAFVLDYTDNLVRPLKVPNARLLYLGGNGAPANPNETPMTIMSRQEYMDLPNKRSQGAPKQWFYSPQRDSGFFYIWPVPVTTAWAIRFTWYRPLQDFFLPGNTMDFPQEWFAPLMWNLSRDLMGIYSTPPARQQYIMNQAAQYGDLAVSYDRESEPIQFGMDWATANND